MDPGEAPHDNRDAPEVPRLERGVLAAGTLAVVLVANDDPGHTRVPVLTRDFGNLTNLSGELVDNRVGLAVLGVDGADEHVVADVGEVATELEPGTRHGDVVGGALAESLDQHRAVDVVLSVPLIKRLEKLETLGLGVDVDCHAASVSLGSLEDGIVDIPAARRNGGTAFGDLKAELTAVGGGKGVGVGVEVEPAGERQHGHQLRARDKRVRVGVSVVALGKVAIVGGDNRVLHPRGHLALPLADARAARLGKDSRAGVLEVFDEAILLDVHLHRPGARGDEERDLVLESRGERLAGEVGAFRHVLVGAVGARPDEAGGNLHGPALLCGPRAQLGHGGAQVGGVRSVDVRRERVEVNLNHAIVLASLVGDQVGAVLSRQPGNILPASLAEVLELALREGKNGGCGANLRTHVADGGHTSGGHGVHTLAKVLDDGAGASRDGQNVGNLENDILGRGPISEGTLQVDANHLWRLELPGQAGHDVHRIRAAHSHGAHAQTTRVGGVGVGTDHQAAGEGVVLQHRLMNDTRAGLPVPHAKLVAAR